MVALPRGSLVSCGPHIHPERADPMQLLQWFQRLDGTGTPRCRLVPGSHKTTKTWGNKCVATKLQ